jgi:hypothetical protein
LSRLLSGAPSSRTAGATSSRTHCTIASAKVQRRIAGGVTATRVLSGSITASSCTTSWAPHSLGPEIGGSEGATASAGVRRRRQADGGAGTSGFDAWVVDAGPASAGRGRGNGTVWAIATSQAAASRMMG